MAIAATVTRGPAILSAQTVEQSAAQGADATTTATEVEIQRRFNELRSELLDDRADTINWWLAATAIFLTLIGVVTPLVGAIAAYIGFNRFRSIEVEARQSAEQARKSAAEAAVHIEGIRRSRVRAEEDSQRIRASLQQAVEDNEIIQYYRNIDSTEEIDQAAQEDRDRLRSPLLDRAIARAYSLQDEGKIEEAIGKWRAIAHVAEGIDNELAAHAWFSVGYLQEEEGMEKAVEARVREAIHAYDQAIFLKPDYAKAYVNRGNEKGRLGRHKEAIADYDRALRLRPDLAGAYANRGTAKSNLGHHYEALADYDQAIRLQPDLSGAYVNRGNVKNRLNRYDDAIDDYDQALLLQPDLAPAYNNRGAAMSSLDRHREAIADCDQAILLQPDYAAAYVTRG